MRSHPVELDVWLLVWPFVCFHNSYMRTAMALVSLRKCAGSPEPSLVAYAISTIILWAGSYVFMEKHGKISLNYHQIPTVICCSGLGTEEIHCSLLLPPDVTAVKFIIQWQQSKFRSTGLYSNTVCYVHFKGVTYWVEQQNIQKKNPIYNKYISLLTK